MDKGELIEALKNIDPNEAEQIADKMVEYIDKYINSMEITIPAIFVSTMGNSSRQEGYTKEVKLKFKDSITWQKEQT
mgnify:CR=1 FL=1